VEATGTEEEKKKKKKSHYRDGQFPAVLRFLKAKIKFFLFFVCRCIGQF
jgi:hypothetical protein